jgi:hypothetical protein
MFLAIYQIPPTCHCYNDSIGETLRIQTQLHRRFDVPQQQSLRYQAFGVVTCLYLERTCRFSLGDGVEGVLNFLYNSYTTPNVRSLTLTLLRFDKRFVKLSALFLFMY